VLSRDISGGPAFTQRGFANANQIVYEQHFEMQLDFLALPEANHPFGNIGFFNE